MPVVRELVNRLSFKINPGDLKNANAAFTKMKGGGAGVISVVSGIKDAFKFALTSIGLLTVAGAEMYRQFEKDTGIANFLASNREEAQRLIEALDEVAAKSETTSRREARQAAATLAGVAADVTKFIPFIEQISIANPGRDFNEVAESLASIIQGGSLQEFSKLIPGIKNELSLLAKTRFGQAFESLMPGQRAEIVLDNLLKSRKRINELALEQQKTLNIEYVKMFKEGSDFVGKFGKETSPVIKDVVVIIKGMLKELNDSQRFWEVVKSTVEAIRTTLELVTGKKTIGGILLGGEEKAKEIFEAGRKEREKIVSGGVPFMPGDRPGDFGLPKLVQEKRQNAVPGYFTSRNEIMSVNVGGEITVKGEGLEGMNVDDLSAKITTQFLGRIEDAFTNSIVQNGGFAGVGAR